MSVEELVDVQVDPNKPNRVIKIGKRLSKELAQQLTEFLCHNKDMCHQLNIDPQVKPVCQKWRVLDVDHYKALQDEVDYLLKIGFIRKSYYPN